MARENITANIDSDLKRKIVAEARERSMSISEFAGLLLSRDIEINDGLTGEDLNAIRSILREELEQEISPSKIEYEEEEEKGDIIPTGDRSDVKLSPRILQIIDYHLEKLQEVGIESTRAEFIQRAILQALKSDGVHWDSLFFKGGLYAKSARWFENCLINEEKHIKSK